MSDSGREKPFIFQKISNQGTSNPIVARLTYQAIDFIKYMDLDDKAQQKLFEILLELQRRLLQCSDIHLRLVEAKNQALKETYEILARGDRTIPHVLGLVTEAEAFLMGSKPYIRDIVALVNVLFNANLPIDASVFWDPKGTESKIAVWAKSKFGPDNELARMLADEHNWIAELVRKRNASEHPSGKSGTLVVENFSAAPQGFIPPYWKRIGTNAFPETDFYLDIATYMENMLTVAEDVMAYGFMSRRRFPMIKLIEIPPEKRDPKAPVRLVVTVDLPLSPKV